jgi:hypothetical protein
MVEKSRKILRNSRVSQRITGYRVPLTRVKKSSLMLIRLPYLEVVKNIWVALPAQCAQDKAPHLGGLTTDI